MEPIDHDSASLRPIRVFMSYARKDNTRLGGRLTQLATRIVEQANGSEAARIELFYDRDISAGEEFPERLRVEVLRADILLLFVSTAFCESDWCQRERTIFEEARRRRKTRGGPGSERRVLWVAVENIGAEALHAQHLDTLQAWITASEWANHDPQAPDALVIKASEALLHLAAQVSSPQGSPVRFGQPAPLPEQLQFLGAFDSVRTQRSALPDTRQLGPVALRAQLAYLFGHTIVLADTQAFDSLGAISCVSQAARAWQNLRSRPPVAPFRVAYFGAPHSHLVDVAERRLAGDFLSSAWHEHSRHREAGDKEARATDDPRAFQEWPDFLEAAELLSWFACERTAKYGARGLGHRMRAIRDRAARIDLHDPPLAHALDVLQREAEARLISRKSKLITRSDLYAIIDEPSDDARLSDPERKEALKDLVDIAYNCTVAQTVLHAATGNPARRSMILTDPTPESIHPDISPLVRFMIEAETEQAAEDVHDALRPQLVSAWDGARSKGDGRDGPELPWERVFEVAQTPAWSTLRNALIEARSARAGRDRDQRVNSARLDLVSFLQDELPKNVIAAAPREEVFSVNLIDSINVAGLGNTTEARAQETGVVAEGHDVG